LAAGSRTELLWRRYTSSRWRHFFIVLGLGLTPLPTDSGTIFISRVFNAGRHRRRLHDRSRERHAGALQSIENTSPMTGEACNWRKATSELESVGSKLLSLIKFRIRNITLPRLEGEH
jgi:hypothetical protein